MPWRRPALLALMVASGFAGLGYQIVWTQQAALWLGHEAAAVFAVVTAFFGGLALGAWTLGRRIEASARPAQGYAACEVAIAVWSGVLALAMPPLSDVLLRLIGAEPAPLWHAGLAFIGCFLLLLPATAAMGATLPAMAAALSRGLAGGAADLAGAVGVADRPAARSPIAALYASNTAGAVLGVLATAFWLVPQFGLARTAAGCAVLNLLCAALAWALAARTLAGPSLPALPSAPSAPPSPSAPPWQPLASATPSTLSPPGQGQVLPAAPGWELLAATGFLGIGYELLVVRVLSQVTENTVYTFATLLAIYLLGTAAGAALYARLAPAAPGTALRHALVAAVAWACLAGTGSLWAAEALRDAATAWRGPDAAATLAWALAAEALPALLAFALPTVAMGALFSHLATQARQAGVPLGQTLAANTLGAAAAPPALGLLLVPALGSKGALLAVVAGYLLLLLGPGLVARVRQAGQGQVVGGSRAGPSLAVSAVAAGAGAAAIGLAALAPPLAFVSLAPGGQLLRYEEGALAAVSVVADADGVARLHINNRQQEGSSATRLADARQALLPLLLHPAPQRVLFLGLGTGVTAGAAAADPALQVDAAELLPEVIAAAELFRSPGEARPRVVAADARRFARAPGPAYDIVVSDNFHPARSGSALLYTVEHFRAVQARLQPGGLFCQWLPLHQIDLNSLRSVVQSFLAVYPGAVAVLATHSLQTPVLGLVGQAAVAPAVAPDIASGGRSASTAAPRFSAAALRARQASYRAQPLQDYGLGDEFALLGSIVAGPQALAQWSAGAPLNTDDHPRVAYLAPRITYVPEGLPADRLQALLQGLAQAPTDPRSVVDFSTDPRQVVDAAVDAAWPQRLAAYWAARDRFIDAGRAVRPSADARQMLAQVQAPLLAVLQTSPDFRPAFDPLQRMAQQLAAVDPAAAQGLLAALAQIDARRGHAAESRPAAQP